MISYEALEALVGVGIVGASYLGLNYNFRQNKKTAAARRIVDKETEGAKKAAEKLKATAFYLDIDSLRGEIKGKIHLPTDGEAYHTCRRRAFNQSQRGFPLCVVRVASASDVVACVRFAEKHRTEVNLCVASGGHSCKCMVDGSFVVDLVHMNKVEVDQASLRVTVEGGAYLEEIDKALKKYNCGVPVGTYPQTGVGGLTLGGGYGFLGRQKGLTVDSFLEAEIVLHSGEIVIANDFGQYSDLIWGLRGGSGNFGIVTKFTFQAHKLPTYCVAGIVAQFTPTLSSAVNVATNFDRLVSEMPNNMSTSFLFTGGSSNCSSLWSYFGEKNSVSEVPELQKAGKLGGWYTLVNNIKPLSYHSDLQTYITPFIDSGFIYQTLIQFGEIGKPVPTACWESILNFTRQPLHPAILKATVLVMAMGGEVSKIDLEGKKTCIPTSIRKAKFFAFVEAYWKPEFGEDGKEAARQWSKSIVETLKPFSNEVLRYAAADNSLATAEVIEEGKDRIGYSSNNYNQLRELKKKYDPTNFFRNNVNILPAV